MGWVLIILGVVQLTGGFSLIAGNTYGRVIGIIAGSLGALGALFSIGGDNPWWSLCVFALCVYVVYGIIVFGEDESAVRSVERGPGGPFSLKPMAWGPAAAGSNGFECPRHKAISSDRGDGEGARMRSGSATGQFARTRSKVSDRSGRETLPIPDRPACRADHL